MRFAAIPTLAYHLTAFYIVSTNYVQCRRIIQIGCYYTWITQNVNGDYVVQSIEY